MTIVDRLRYDGKRALVVGGATGMGAAAAKSAAELGAEVIVMDYAPVTYDVAKYIQVDLRDPPRSTRRSSSWTAPSTPCSRRPVLPTARPTC